MKFTVANILDQLPQSGSTLEVKRLEKILKLSNKSDRNYLEIAIDALIKLGIIHKDENNSIKIVQNDSILEARIRCSSKGYCFAVRDDGSEDIYIREQHLNHAWNGDKVLVKIVREGVRRRSPEGEVQCILERSTRGLLGVVEEQDQQVIGLPLDERLLTPIKLPDDDKKYITTENDSNVVEIKIDRFPVGQFLSEGHVARLLPLNGGEEGDRELILTKAKLHEQSSAPRTTLKIPSNKKRIDLTDQQCLLLNGWNSDQAPSLPAVAAETHNGGIRFWIHSPAIAERLGIGNTLDMWLRDKCNAHCLGNTWSPLLNKRLTKESRFEVNESNDAVSVCIDINKEGHIKDWKFSLTTIKPAALIDHTILHALANKKPKSRTVPTAIKHIKDQLDQLKTILFCAVTINNLEKEKGSIELDLPVPNREVLGDIIIEDPSSSINQWTTPLNIEDPNSVLAVLIRTAQFAWSEHLKELNLPGLLVENSREIGNLNDVAKSALALEVEIELNEDGSPSTNELLKAISMSNYKRIIEKQLRHALSQTQVKLNSDIDTDSESNIKQEEITNQYYFLNQAPWCCPTIHYLDLANQYVITTLLNEGKSRASARSRVSVELGKKDCTKQITWSIFSDSVKNNLMSLFSNNLLKKIIAGRRESNLLNKDLINMSQARAAEPLIGNDLEAIITGVQSYGFFAEIKESMIEGLVHVSSLNDDWYEYRSRQSRLVGRKSRKSYQVGDNIIVRIIKVDILRNQIDLEIDDKAKIDNINSTNESSNLPTDEIEED